MTQSKYEKGSIRTILIGASVLLAITIGFSSLLLFWRKIPGVIGEATGTIAGVVSTPFFMEGFFILLGFTTVIALNIWRRQKNGDDFVTLEIENKDSLPSEPKG